MFDWAVEGVRYVFWIMYAGMCTFISSIYQTLLAIPNVLNKVLNDDSVDSLFHSMRSLFFVFAGLMLVVIVISRAFDFNISKMMGQVKKVFLLAFILIGMPWFITEAEKITNGLINTGSNTMTSELGKTSSTDFGVSLANTYIYKNERYSEADEFADADEAPFSNVGDIGDKNIINTKIKDTEGDDVYIYDFFNPILGVILNIAIILLLILANLKVYGYLYQLVVLKVWTPFKAIKSGFDETPISEIFGDFVTAFISFAIQIVIVPFSLIMINVLTNIDGINLFEQLCAIGVGLYYMVFGIEYIQTKFMSQSGVPSVFELYAFAQLGKNIGKGAGDLAQGIGKGLGDTARGFGDMFEKIRSNGEGDSLIDTGRTADITNPTDITDSDDVDMNNDINEDIDSQNNIDDGSISDIDDEIKAFEDIENEIYNDDVDETLENVTVPTDIDIENAGLESISKGVDDISQGLNDKDHIKDTGTNDINSANRSKQDIPNDLKPTDKQTKLAESMGIEVSGKDKYQIGNEIEKHIKDNKQVNTSSKYEQPKYEQPTSVDKEFKTKFDDIINGGW